MIKNGKTFYGLCGTYKNLLVEISSNNFVVIKEEELRSMYLSYPSLRATGMFYDFLNNELVCD